VLSEVVGHGRGVLVQRDGDPAGDVFLRYSGNSSRRHGTPPGMNAAIRDMSRDSSICELAARIGRRGRVPDGRQAQQRYHLAMRDQDISLPPGTDRITEIVATEITRQHKPQE
jgi:hypothetical protein